MIREQKRGLGAGRVWGVQAPIGYIYRSNQRDRYQSMLGQINTYGSIVAILARFAFKFEIQVPQLNNYPRELKRSGSSCF